MLTRDQMIDRIQDIDDELNMLDEQIARLEGDMSTLREEQDKLMEALDETNDGESASDTDWRKAERRQMGITD